MSEKQPENQPPAAPAQPAAAPATPAQPPTERIKVEVGRDPEVESLRREVTEKENLLKQTQSEKDQALAGKKAAEDKLQEKEGILQQKALTEFEEEKKKILDLIKDSGLTDEQKQEIEDKLQTPKNLEIVKALVGMMVSAIKQPENQPPAAPAQPAPSGRAPITPPESKGEQFESKVAMVDELYRRAYYQPELYTPEQVTDAKTKINTLFNTLINSESWKQLKRGDAASILKSLTVMSCPKCGKTFLNELPPKCPQCGFNLSKTGNFMER